MIIPTTFHKSSVKRGHFFAGFVSSSNPLSGELYLTLVDVIYHKGSSDEDTTVNFRSTGLESDQDCYTLCLSRNDQNCFSFR